MQFRTQILIFISYLLLAFHAGAQPLCADLFYRKVSEQDHLEAAFNNYFNSQVKTRESSWTPRPAKVSGKSELPIAEIRFMQNSAKVETNDGHGVIDNALRLRSGELKITDFPKINVWKDIKGRHWTLDHRRLASYILSGVISRVPVRYAALHEIQFSSYKFTTLDMGNTLQLFERGSPNPQLVRRATEHERLSVAHNEESIRQSLDQIPSISFDAQALVRELTGLSFIEVIPSELIPKGIKVSKHFAVDLHRSQVNQPAVLRPHQVRFMESKISDQLEGGANVFQIAGLIQRKLISSSYLPPLRVWSDQKGRIWTPDGPLLSVFLLANTNEVPVRWMTTPELTNLTISTFTDGRTAIIEHGTVGVIAGY